MALTKDNRASKKKGNSVHSDPVKAAAKLYAGGLICLDATGHAVAGSASTTLKARGRCLKQVDNSAGADGDVNVDTETGVFNFKNSAAGDLITIADIGNDCYIVDDETVAKTDGTGTRSIAGRIDSIDSHGVWVEIK